MKEESKGGRVKVEGSPSHLLPSAIQAHVLPAAFVALLSLTASAFAQSPPPRFEVGGQVTAVDSREFDRTDVGIGGRFGWRPLAPVGVEAELDVYPRAFPGPVPFSRRRMEALVGVTVGPDLGRVRPFARVRAGVADFAEAPAPMACIAIYPPPLSCTMAQGQQLRLIDVGGGVEVPVAGKTFVRIDVGERFVRYPGPVFDAKRTIRQNGFYGHDLRVAMGGGLRF